MSLTNQKCLAQPALINLHPNKYGQELRYYPFAVNLDRCVTSYNTFHKLSNKVCAPNETEKINLYVINMITSINESKILAKSCRCECKFDSKKCNFDHKWNNEKCRCERRNPEEYNSCEKDYIWNPDTSSYENGKYLGSVIDDSVITCDETIDTTKITSAKRTSKTFPTKQCSNKKMLQQNSILYWLFYELP